MEQRPAYLGTRSDYFTHVHDLPPQLGGEPSSSRIARALGWRRPLPHSCQLMSCISDLQIAPCATSDGIWK